MLDSQINANAKKKERRKFSEWKLQKQGQIGVLHFKDDNSLDFIFPAIVLIKLQPQKWKIYVFLENH